MDLLEKIVWGLTGLTIVGVVACAVLGPFKSEISADAVWGDAFDNANALGRLDEGQAVELGGGRVKPRLKPKATGGNKPSSGPARPRTAGGGGETGPGPGGPDEASREPYEPGVVVGEATEYETIYLPQAVKQKYRHFEDLYDLGMTASSVEIEKDGQLYVQIEEMNEGSPLQERLGFQPGDILISVNGNQANSDNARQLYEQLKNETQFRVEIERDGQRLIIPYQVR